MCFSSSTRMCFKCVCPAVTVLHSLSSVSQTASCCSSALCIHYSLSPSLVCSLHHFFKLWINYSSPSLCLHFHSCGYNRLFPVHWELLEGLMYSGLSPFTHVVFTLHTPHNSMFRTVSYNMKKHICLMDMNNVWPSTSVSIGDWWLNQGISLWRYLIRVI